MAPEMHHFFRFPKPKDSDKIELITSSLRSNGNGDGTRTRDGEDGSPHGTTTVTLQSSRKSILTG